MISSLKTSQGLEVDHTVRIIALNQMYKNFPSNIITPNWRQKFIKTSITFVQECYAAVTEN